MDLGSMICINLTLQTFTVINLNLKLLTSKIYHVGLGSSIRISTNAIESEQQNAVPPKIYQILIS
jgi:hypothetical protein